MDKRCDDIAPARSSISARGELGQGIEPCADWDRQRDSDLLQGSAQRRHAGTRARLPTYFFYIMAGMDEPSGHDISGIGRAVHRVTARLLQRGLRAPSRNAIVDQVRCEPVAGLPHVYGLAARQRATAAVSLYFHLFVPGPQWEFMGAEIPVPGADLDLGFSERGGRIRADELKTGVAAADGQDPGLDRQLARALAGGLVRFGDRFQGIRVLLLAAPTQSFMALPNGLRTMLPELAQDECVVVETRTSASGRIARRGG